MRKTVFLILLAGVLAACQSTQPEPAPCNPVIQPKPYPVPVFVAVPIPELPPPELPAFPSPPRTGAGEQEWKEYALIVGEIAEQRTALREADAAALRLQIRANNEYARRHPAPTPTPEPPPE